MPVGLADPGVFSLGHIYLVYVSCSTAHRPCHDSIRVPIMHSCFYFTCTVLLYGNQIVAAFARAEKRVWSPYILKHVTRHLFDDDNSMREGLSLSVSIRWADTERRSGHREGNYRCMRRISVKCIRWYRKIPCIGVAFDLIPRYLVCRMCIGDDLYVSLGGRA
jgi:hypothetical protein